MSVSGLARTVVTGVMPPLHLKDSSRHPETGGSYRYEILDETPPGRSAATPGLPVGDQRVLGEEPGQCRP